MRRGDDSSGVGRRMAWVLTSCMGSLALGAVPGVFEKVPVGAPDEELIADHRSTGSGRNSGV
jgi:hypothetical protein